MKQFSNRRLAREIALQILFQTEFTGLSKFEDYSELYRGQYDAAPEVWSYANSLINGVSENKTEIDKLISSQSAHWALDRMALVDLIIMRIGLFEVKLSTDPVPSAAVINEAVEISRKYGTTDSASFVNGLLDKLLVEIK